MIIISSSGEDYISHEVPHPHSQKSCVDRVPQSASDQVASWFFSFTYHLLKIKISLHGDEDNFSCDVFNIR